jgi:hypothetical protein
MEVPSRSPNLRDPSFRLAFCSVLSSFGLRYSDCGICIRRHPVGCATIVLGPEQRGSPLVGCSPDCMHRAVNCTGATVEDAFLALLSSLRPCLACRLQPFQYSFIWPGPACIPSLPFRYGPYGGSFCDFLWLSLSAQYQLRLFYSTYSLHGQQHRPRVDMSRSLSYRVPPSFPAPTPPRTLPVACLISTGGADVRCLPPPPTRHRSPAVLHAHSVHQHHPHVHPPSLCPFTNHGPRTGAAKSRTSV